EASLTTLLTLPTLPTLPTLLLRSLTSSGWGHEPDHLHPRAASDVHGLDHVLIPPGPARLDEHELRRTLVIHHVQLRIQPLLGHRLGVDGVTAVIQQLQHDLVALGLLFLLGLL